MTDHSFENEPENSQEFQRFREQIDLKCQKYKEARLKDHDNQEQVINQIVQEITSDSSSEERISTQKQTLLTLIQQSKAELEQELLELSSTSSTTTRPTH